MKKGFDLHGVYQVRELLIRQINNDQNISPKNKKFIFDYELFRQMSENGISGNVKALQTLKQFAGFLKVDFDIATKEDIIRAISLLRELDLSPYTFSSRKVVIKVFFKWLKNTEDEYPPEVKWIKAGLKKSEKKQITNAELITEEDIKAAIKACNNSRDKALISVLYESGTRIGEFASLQIMNIKFDNIGTVLCVEGKTGLRPIRIISSQPFLATWIENHPFKDIPEAPLWISTDYHTEAKVISYDGLNSVLKRIFKRAGINKNSNPHLFRHSRATFLADYLTEFQMNQYFGWVQGSKMASTYIHMSGRKIDNSLLEMNGIKSNTDKADSQLKPQKCVRCDTMNPFDSKFCRKCGGILDVNTAFEYENKIAKENEVRRKYDDMMNKLLEDPEVIELFKKKICLIENV